MPLPSLFWDGNGGPIEKRGKIHVVFFRDRPKPAEPMTVVEKSLEEAAAQKEAALLAVENLASVASAMGWLADDLPDGVPRDILRALHARLLQCLPPLREAARSRQ